MRSIWNRRQAYIHRGPGFRICENRVSQTLPPKSSKRQIFLDSREVRHVHKRGFAKLTLALRAFGSQQVAFRRVPAQNFTGASHFEALGNSFLRLSTCNWFWHGRGKIVRVWKMAIFFWWTTQNISSTGGLRIQTIANPGRYEKCTGTNRRRSAPRGGRAFLIRAGTSRFPAGQQSETPAANRGSSNDAR